VRAVLASELGFDEEVRYAMWGYSGGALGSEWAAELQHHYAPELKFSGVALGGLTPNVTSTVESVTGKFYAGLIPQGFLGLASQSPEAMKALLGSLKTTGPYNSTGFLAARDMSFAKSVGTYAFQNIFNYFVDGAEFLQIPSVKKLWTTNGIMGLHGVPRMPLFVYKSILDEVSVIGETDALVEKYCRKGADILYERNTVGSHAQELVLGDYKAFQWLITTLEGTYGPKVAGCSVKIVTINGTSLGE